jgi:hypothetical protein
VRIVLREIRKLRKNIMRDFEILEFVVSLFELLFS